MPIQTLPGGKLAAYRGDSIELRVRSRLDLWIGLSEQTGH